MLKTSVLCPVRESNGMERGTDYYKISSLSLVQRLLSPETDRSLSNSVHAHFWKCKWAKSRPLKEESINLVDNGDFLS